MSAFEQAWLLLKSSSHIYPVGKYAGRNIATMGGVPYYQSLGESFTPGFGYKAKGTWYPFDGIDMREGHLKKGPRQDEHYKRVHPDGHPDHEFDWSGKEPNVAGQKLAQHFSQNEHLHDSMFPELSPKEINKKLFLISNHYAPNPEDPRPYLQNIDDTAPTKVAPRVNFDDEAGDTLF